MLVKVPAFVTRGDGAGTNASPYLITNLEDLQDLSEVTSKYNKYYNGSYYFKLTNDIDGGGAHINPIGYSETSYGASWSYYFGGTFDGNGKTISNIVIDQITGDNYCGLFNRLGYTDNTYPSLKNLTLKSCTINGGSARYVGALTGSVSNGTFTGNKVINCKIYSNSSQNSGVLAGYLYSGSTCSNNQYYSSCQVIIGGTTYTYGTGIGANGIGIGLDYTNGFKADVAGKYEVVMNLKANFYYKGHLLFTHYAPGEGGMLYEFPTVAELESDYFIKNATFTLDGSPFTAETVIDSDVDVTVEGTPVVTSISLSASKTKLYVGETVTVSTTIAPVYADYTLTSSDPSVATVAQDGTVTYAAAGTTTITATANDDPTKTAAVVITCVAANVATFGESATYSDYNVPYGTYYQYATTQQLYTPAEVGSAGTIHALAFKVAQSGSVATNSIKIYLGHKDGVFSSYSNYVPSSELTLVYEGSPTIGQTTGWERIEFNQGTFEYNGLDNLVVVVCNSAVNSNSNLKYYYTSQYSYTLYRRGSSSVYADITNTSNYYSTSSYRPSVQFLIEPKAKELMDGVAYTYTADKTVDQITYKRSFDSERVGKFQAWFVPFDYTITDADLEKFDFFKINFIANAGQEGVNPEDDHVYIFLNPMAAGAVLKGNMPYVYRPKAVVTDYPFTVENATLLARNTTARLQNETTLATYQFFGTYEDTEATALDPFYYVNISGTVSYGDAVTVGPYRWILRATTKGGISYARQFTFVEDESTAIGRVVVHSQESIADGQYYDLQGRKVAHPQKGVYIVNGKKVVIK